MRWDKDNKRLVKAFNTMWVDYERRAGNQKPLTKQERWALREVRADPKYNAWRTEKGTKNPVWMRRMNHPNAVINAYKASHATESGGERKPSPYAQMKATNIELQEQLNKTQDGDRWKPTDTADNISPR